MASAMITQLTIRKAAISIFFFILICFVPVEEGAV